MRIRIKNKEILLNNAEVASAKKITTEFLEHVRKNSRENNQPTYYFTVLIVMNALSQELIEEMDIKNLEMLMNSIEQIRQNNQPLQ